MKTEKFQWLSIFFLFCLLLSSSAAFAGVFDNDEENWRRMFRDIKKINSRLVTLETGKMQALENVQKDLYIQLEEIKNLIPNLQGSVEQSQGEITAQFQHINGKLADIENQIKLDIIESINQQLTKIEKQASIQLNQQKIANDKFQANLATQFDQLKSHMAGDMENFHRVSKEFFKEFDQSNRQSLDKVVERLNEQQQTLDRTQEIFKTDLIPVIVQQNEKNIKQINVIVSNASKESKEALTAGLGNIQVENQKLFEIFQRSLKEGETIRTNIERLSQSIRLTDDNVVRIHGDIVKLKDVLAQQTGQLAEGLKVIQAQSHASAASLASLQQNVAQIKGDNALGDEKLNKLISSSTELAVHSNDIHQSLQSVSQALQGIEEGLANVDLSNQKLSKLIDILKTMAMEQGKLTQVLSGQGEIKQSQAQILKTQVELNKAQVQISQGQGLINQAQREEIQGKNQISQNQAQVLKVQKELRQAQAQILKTQTQILKAQEEIRNTQRQSLLDQKAVNKTLAELSRKANVNISRNNAIRKTLANIGKRP